MSKFDRNAIKDGWEKLCTNKQTDKPTDTTKIMVTWPWTNDWAKKQGSAVADIPMQCAASRRTRCKQVRWMQSVINLRPN